MKTEYPYIIAGNNLAWLKCLHCNDRMPLAGGCSFDMMLIILDQYKTEHMGCKCPDQQCKHGES